VSSVISVAEERKRVYRLTKHEIIRRPGEFSSIFQNGRFLRGRFFDLTYVGGDDRQAGFTVSKRIRTAVGRNRIKRMLREAFRLEKNGFHARVRLILIGRENIFQADLEDLRKEMRKMAAKIAANHQSGGL
jgi:ribonuclease P protein component